MLDHCKNFSDLKVLCPSMVDLAKAISASIPNLKVLSLQCCLVEKEALVYILNNMKNLEVLNLCHCFIVDEGLLRPGYAYVARALDNSIIERASRMKQFLFCDADSCRVCPLMFVTEGSSIAVVRLWNLAKGHSEYTCSTLIWRRNHLLGNHYCMVS